MGSRIGPLVYPVFFLFVFRQLRICVTVYFATYLLLLIHIVCRSALLKQCSGAKVRFSDSSSFGFGGCLDSAVGSLAQGLEIIYIYLASHEFSEYTFFLL